MKSLAKIFIRVFSLFLLIRGIEIIPIFLMCSSYEEDVKFQIYSYNTVSVALNSICGILLWIFAGFIANRIVKKDSDNISINYKDMQTTAFSVVGLIIIINSFPAFAKNIFNILSTSNFTYHIYSSAIQQYKNDVIENAIKAVMGIWLFFGSRGMVNLISKIRNNDSATYNELKIEDKTEAEDEEL